MTRAVLSIGSNLGDRWRILADAVRHFEPWVVGVSAVFETPPWGPVAQEDFLNAIMVVDDPAADASEWLRRAHAAEQAAARTRTIRWGPRTLDVDIVAVDDVRSEDPELTLPHPRAAQRAFVLVPWLQLDPDAVLPGWGRVADLVAALPADDTAGVCRRDDLAALGAR